MIGIKGRYDIMIYMKTIADMVNHENASIDYYLFDKANIRDNIVSFVALSKQEKEIYEVMNKKEKRNYVSKEPLISIPKLSVYACAELYKVGKFSVYDYTLQKVKKLTSIENINDNDVAVCLYMILHEFGHWNDFVKLGNKPYEFTIHDAKERENIYKHRQELERQIKLGKLEDEKSALEDYMIKYNSVSMEKRANAYADTHYELAYNLLKTNSK